MVVQVEHNPNERTVRTYFSRSSQQTEPFPNQGWRNAQAHHLLEHPARVGQIVDEWVQG